MREDDWPWVKALWEQNWHGDFIVTRGRVHRLDDVSGFVAEKENAHAALIIYRTDRQEMEIVSIDSRFERQGIGTALVARAVETGKQASVKRIMAITTNDNLNALGFWQKRGFCLTAVYPRALEATRRLKPGITLVGENGIPLRDEIELEMRL